MDINTLVEKFPRAGYISVHEATISRGWVQLTAPQARHIASGLRYCLKTKARVRTWYVRCRVGSGTGLKQAKQSRKHYTVYQLVAHANDIVRSPKASKRMRQLAFDALAQMLPTA